MVNIAVIPARSGSKGIPKKNLRMLAGKPLVAWTIEAAQRAKSIDQIVVSIDDNDTWEIAHKYSGVETSWRSEELSEDGVHAIHIVKDHLNFCDLTGIIIDRVAMLLPTAPLRTAMDIDNAFSMLDYYPVTAVVGVNKVDAPESNFRYIKDNHILEPIKPTDGYEIQRQDISNIVYKVNGAMFVATANHIKKYESFHKGSPAGYIMDKISSIDINDMDDFRIAEAILCRR